MPYGYHRPAIPNRTLRHKYCHPVSRGGNAVPRATVVVNTVGEGARSQSHAGNRVAKSLSPFRKAPPSVLSGAAPFQSTTVGVRAMKILSQCALAGVLFSVALACATPVELPDDLRVVNPNALGDSGVPGGGSGGSAGNGGIGQGGSGQPPTSRLLGCPSAPKRSLQKA